MKTPELLEDLGMQLSNETSKQKRRHGMWKCECGTVFRCQTFSITSGKTVSCGCFHKKMVAESSTTHGLGNHRLYHIWTSIVDRTSNHNNKQYKDYGGRGVTLCEEWKDVTVFITDMEPTYREGLTIDRKDNDLGYSKTNCRWATRSTQQCNSRDIRANNTSGYKGIVWQESRKKWAAQIGINRKVIGLGRFNTIQEAITRRNEYIIENNLEHTLGVYIG